MELVEEQQWTIGEIEPVANDYYANPRMSNSKANILEDSPELFDAYFVSKTLQQEVTPEMMFGSLLHTFVLEPHLIATRYVTVPECDRRTKVGKEIWANFCQERGDRIPVDLGHLALCEQIKQAIDKNSGVSRLLNLPGNQIEREFFFQRSAVDCKAKMDVVNLDSGVIIDLKTSSDPSPRGFSRSVVDYGYHRQAAMYLDAVKQQTGVECRMVFIVVNKKAPFVAAIYELSSELVDIGRMQLDGLLEEYKRRSATGNWVSDWADGGIHEIVKPKWY
jgi:hypothetical protein